MSETTSANGTTTGSRVHPFEKAGLGVGPFKCVGHERRVGPIRTEIAGGFTLEVGAPGQPMGTCDYCGTGIADCYRIRSADGKTFVVGSDCVLKTYRDCAGRIPSDIEREIKRVKNERARERRHAKEAAIAAEWAPRIEAAKAALAAHPEMLTDATHPSPYYAGQGRTRRDYVLWLLTECYSFPMRQGGAVEVEKWLARGAAPAEAPAAV